jgi:PCFT/HCP family folate transporter-like MFS transporter 1/3
LGITVLIQYKEKLVGVSRLKKFENHCTHKIISILDGTLNLFFLFEQKKFNWSVSEANLYESATMALTVFGTLSGLFVMKRLLNLADMTIIIISFFSKIFATFIITFASVGWHLYLASGVGFLGNLYGSFCRGVFSKTVDKEEVGKIFTVTTTLEAFWTLAAAPIYTVIYTHTYLTFTSAFNLLTVAVLILNVTLAL